MQLTVILSTYNSPDWLEKVLWGYSRQSHTDFEIIIADDGSTNDTAARVRQLRRTTGLELRHLWQRDDGFRKCRILNKAILAAQTEYLVFSDGDCIPRPDYLQTHAARAERGHYLSGGYYKLPMVTSQAIRPDDVLSGACFDRGWLHRHGMPVSTKELKLAAGPVLARGLNRLTPTRCNFKGSNGSCWRRDALAVNGFNEDMAYGSEDREFGVRLQNLGIRPRHVRYDAIVVHLDHPRGYRDEAVYARNRSIRRHAERHHVIRAARGLQELSAAGWTPAAATPPSA